MSATTTEIAGNRRSADSDRRPGIGRLTAVELRKMTDTRSGFWMPIAVTLVTLAVALIATLNHGGQDANFGHIFNVITRPAAFLLPVMGILLVCGEWSQRTTLTTFTLVPSRARVIAAKLGASLIVSTISLIVCLALTFVIPTLFGSPPGGTGSLSLTVILQGWLFLVSWMVMGLAFGAAILVSAPAIVAYFLIPTIWDAVIGGIHGLAGVARWLDSSNTLAPLTQHSLDGTQWAHAFATFAVWIGIPIVAGALRIGRGDVD
jgi:ABC-2 type transport system permease protein